MPNVSNGTPASIPVDLPVVAASIPSVGTGTAPASPLNTSLPPAVMLSAAASVAQLTPATTILPNEQLLTEIAIFLADTEHRYKFNNRWDIVLSSFGILLSIALVAAGFTKEPIISAVLGALMGAVVTAQKAFPFGQRAMFYRLLIGQVANLQTSASQGLISSADTVAKFCSLRMDFAQQLPRGSTTTPQDPTPQDSQNAHTTGIAPHA